MFEFELDNSNYYDFKLKDNKHVILNQDFILPILEIIPIKTKNFDGLLKLIQNAYATFSMYDYSNCYRILDKAAIINFNTILNNYNNIDDTCNNILDFTIQYHFTEQDLSKSGSYTGEFKIVFSNNTEEKTLIVPIINKINILINPSNNKLKIKSLPTTEINDSILIDSGDDFLLSDENTYLIYT
jgi:hypothetical protein